MNLSRLPIIILHNNKSEFYFFVKSQIFYSFWIRGGCDIIDYRSYFLLAFGQNGCFVLLTGKRTFLTSIPNLRYHWLTEMRSPELRVLFHVYFNSQENSPEKLTIVNALEYIIFCEKNIGDSFTLKVPPEYIYFGDRHIFLSCWIMVV